MSHYPWKPIRLENLEQQIDCAFDDLIHRWWGVRPSADWQPDIDVYETAEAYLVEVDLPGVAADAIHVEIEKHALTITGTRSSETVEKTTQSVRVELRKGQFSRRFPLAHAVDPGAATRSHKEGTLHLVIPKLSSS